MIWMNNVNKIKHIQTNFCRSLTLIQLYTCCGDNNFHIICRTTFLSWLSLQRRSPRGHTNINSFNKQKKDQSEVLNKKKLYMD
jgi:hypothetical protein